MFSKLYVLDPPHDKLDWLKAGLTSGTSIFLWVCLIKQHNEDVFEYKTRGGGNKLFYFQLHPQHVEVPRPGIKTTPQE